MRRDPDWARAEQVLDERLGDRGPAGRRIVAFETDETVFHPELPPIRRVEASILKPGPDVVVFFDQADGLVGWRDDGRLGAAVRPSPPGPAVGIAIAGELGLARPEVRALRPVFLDPLGWTYEARIRARIRGREGALRAWANPETHRVIQVLSGRAFDAGDGALEYRARVAMLDVFEGRLRRAGIRPKPAHRYVVLAPKNVEGYPGGRQVRLTTWRHWSAAMVEVEGLGGPATGWRIDRLADPPARRSAPAAVLIAAAARSAPPPDGAASPAAAPIERTDPPRTWRVSWAHAVDGVPVVGDVHQVDVHAEHGRLVGVRTRWTVDLPAPRAPRLRAADARAAALAAHLERGLDESLVPGPPTLCLVRPTELPSPAHRLAWRVGFADAAGTVDLYLDADDGRVVAVGGSR